MRSFLAVLLLVPALALAQERPDRPRPVVRTDSVTRAMEQVVVTATRTARELESVPVPVTVVTDADIRQQGAARLGDVLEAIPGLFLTDDHGSGLQVQGFSPDYTLVLVDGEPVVGRTAGTLDVSRLTVAGLDRVEVVRGPSSSLYGSEALAGVVNLVTALPRDGAEGELRLRAGTFGTTDLVASAGVGRDRWAVRALVNRFGSGGYDLTPDAFGPTAPPFSDWTADVRSRLDVGRGATLRFGARAALQDQAGGFALPGPDGSEVRYEDNGTRIDWSVHPELTVPLSQRLRLTTTLYGARYRAEIRQARADDGTLYFADDFDQRYGKAEAQLDALWSARHATSLGGGWIDERLAGDRYGMDAPAATQAFAFAQHDWIASRRVELNASARFDAHSDYAARLTPKVAVLVRPTDALRFRASVGSGFKAPAFRQLYLAFSNAAAGYSVFGSTRLADGLAGLQAAGLISQTFLDPATLSDIRSESSVALNAAVSADLTPRVTLDAGVFWNDVHDLIETQPVAQKTNGQFVYGYFNLDRIYTRGVDLGATLRPATGVEVTAGYQFLQARDRAVVDRLRAGTTFGRDPDGRETRLSLSDYGGLFGRSPHALSLRAALSRGDWTASTQARWRSRYGYRDLDGNGLANRPDEFVAGYTVLDATLARSWALPTAGTPRLTLQAGADNLFGITRPTLVPGLPGRTLFASVGLRF